jgi:hypothetical protein
MSWTRSLLKIRAFEVDLLKKRLGEAVTARAEAEAETARLDAELARESSHALAQPSVAHAFAAFRRAWVVRKADALAVVRTRLIEEQGCRDALSEAYAELKKVETVAAGHARAALLEEARLENGRLDEMALRRRTSL